MHVIAAQSDKTLMVISFQVSEVETLICFSKGNYLTASMTQINVLYIAQTHTIHHNCACVSYFPLIRTKWHDSQVNSRSTSSRKKCVAYQKKK